MKKHLTFILSLLVFSVIFGQDKNNTAVIHFQSNAPDDSPLELFLYDDLGVVSKQILFNNDSIVIHFSDDVLKTFGSFNFIIPVRRGDRLVIANNGTKTTTKSVKENAPERQVEVDMYSHYFSTTFRGENTFSKLLDDSNKAQKQKNETAIVDASKHLLEYRLSIAKDFLEKSNISNEHKTLFFNDFRKQYTSAHLTSLWHKIHLAFPENTTLQNKYWEDVIAFFKENDNVGYLRNMLTIIPMKYNPKNTISMLMKDFSGKIQNGLVYNHFQKINDNKTFNEQFLEYKKLPNANTEIIQKLENLYQNRNKYEHLKHQSMVFRKDQSIDLEDFISEQLGNDKMVIVHFWASWCVPCVKELKYLVPLLKEERYKHISIIYISVDEDEKDWLAIQKRLSMESEPNTYITKFNIPYMKKHDVTGYPTSIIYKKSEVKKIIGAINPEILNAN